MKACAYSIFFITLLLCLFRVDLNYAAYSKSIAVTREQLMPMADWLTRNIPKDKKILIHDAGYISWGSQLKLVDLVGLKTPTSVKWHETYTLKSCGKERGTAIAKIAEANKINYAVTLSSWDDIFKITAGLKEAGWRVDLAHREGRYSAYKLDQLSAAPK